MQRAYSVIPLQYSYDSSTGEGLNVGLLMFGQEFAAFGFQPQLKRVRAAYPEMNLPGLRLQLADLQQRADRLQQRMREELNFGAWGKDAKQAALSLLPQEDCSLRWGPMSSGLADDYAAEFDRLQKLYLQGLPHRPEASHGDAMVWKRFSREHLDRAALSRLRHHEVRAGFLEIDFPHSWKAQQWQCLHSASLDLKRRSDFQEKVLRLAGLARGLHQAPDLRVHCLIGQPRQPELFPDYDLSIRFLQSEAKGSPMAIIPEEELPVFGKRVKDEILLAPAN